jgi:hypothetical protein
MSSLKSFSVRSLAALLPLLALSASAADPATRADLNPWERRQFMEMALGSRPQVSAQYLSVPGRGEAMIAALKQLGATVDFADPKSGFALVTVPREKLLTTLDLPDIAFAYTRNDDRMYYQDPAAKIPPADRKAEPVPPIRIPYPRVATTLPAGGPYFATDEIGLSTFWTQHPEADGRGVRVAVPDEGFDLLHPALQQARTASGRLVPKVADLGTVTLPDEDGGWVRFGDPIAAQDGTFEAAGRTWTAPAAGTYRFGILRQELVLGPEGNSHAQKITLSVGVLWSEAQGKVWVDTDGDGSFKNQRALSDYALNHDLDWFGAKEGDDDNRIPFGVKIDAAKQSVYVRIGGGHGALVAGPLAANTLTGGLFNGAAPSAQLIDQNLGRASLLAAMVAMASRPDVDVVNRSGGIGRAGYTGNRKGIEDFAIHVLERLSIVYDKPIAAYSNSAGTIFVNDFAGADMLRRNRQLAPPYRDTINGGLVPMPSGLVNTVLAPSANLETESRYKPLDLPGDDGRRHSYADDEFNPPAPDGYVIGCNNSPTIPVVSGVLADLIGEARREHVRFTAARLNQAIFTGTRLLDGFPISDQGYGLINAAQSWEQLVKMARADDPDNPELTSFTLSRMQDGQSVEVQGFQADLPEPGQKLDGEIIVTRHGGYAGARPYTLSLRGNDGSFTLLDLSATLVRDEPAKIRFSTNGASGWHIVFLELRDVTADVVLQDVPLSVRVPDVPQVIAPGVDRYASDLPPLRSERRYLRVADDTQAVRYVMRIPFVGPDSVRAAPGLSAKETNTPPPGEPVDPAHHVGPLETLESLVLNDEPGTQTIFWENRGRPEYRTPYDLPAPDIAIHAELTVTKYAVTFRKGAGDTLAVSNPLAPVEGRTELFTAAVNTGHLAGTGPHAAGELERTLPAGRALQWRVRVTPESAPAGPADVFILNCTGPNGAYVAAQAEIGASGATLMIDRPSAGLWKILVRSRQTDSPAVTYSVKDALLVPSSTPLESADTLHASGTTWTLPLPKPAGDATYAGFRLKPLPGKKKTKEGLLIGLTQVQGGGF